MAQIEILNLEGCGITSWESLKGVAESSHLNWLILNDNQIKFIPLIEGMLVAQFNVEQIMVCFEFSPACLN